MLHKQALNTLIVLTLLKNNIVSSFQPDFAGPIVNLTIAVGRDATFRCLVQHLGGYRVGWVKADTKAIQAIHDHVITHNPRVSASHSDHSTWNLHIKSVMEEDRGMYMCQINTDPMKSQLGYLDVVVPPDFVPEDTSGDVMIPEGGNVKLTCRARGQPLPHVQWRREDGTDIVIRDINGLKTKVSSYQGEVLKLVKIIRSEMGAYLCIANNHVPPAISKRIMVHVHFHPEIQVPNQLVGAPLGTDVTLECNVEASPKSINYWIRDTGEMVISTNKHVVQMTTKSMFEFHMSITVRRFQHEDVGSYKCIAKNSLGEVESSIRLYEIPGPTRRIFQPISDDDDSVNGWDGSAEKETDDELSNVVPERPVSPRGHTYLNPTRVVHVGSAHGTPNNNPKSSLGNPPPPPPPVRGSADTSNKAGAVLPTNMDTGAAALITITVSLCRVWEGL